MATSRRRAYTVPGLKQGTHPWITTPSGSQRRAGSRHHLPHGSQPVPHSLQVELSASPSPVPSLPVGTAQARGQRTEFPYTLHPLPRTLPGLGFFYRFGGGWGPQGGDPDNKEIGSQFALRWDGLCFLMKVPWPSCPTRKQVCYTRFCSLLHSSLPERALSRVPETDLSGP